MRNVYAHCSWRGLFFVLALAMLPACASAKTKQDYRMAALQGDLYRIAKASKATEKTMEDTQGRLEALETQVQSLEERMKGFTGQLGQDLTGERGAGDAGGQEWTELRGWLQALDSRVKRLQDSLEQLEGHPKPPPDEVKSASKKSATQMVVSEAETKTERAPADQEAQREYDKGYAAYVEHRYDEALAHFESFVKHYPEHHLADNAQYWLGESYYDMGDYASAILAFKDVVTRYSQSPKAPDALLKIGYAYIALDDPSNGRMFLKRLIKNYPSTPAESMAQVKLKELDGP